ncbi:MAG: hypothetical protein MJZ89_01700 [Paludibacteraceae bacterium]|nr:hypothetical protein [Paludibacteraceae bacterium]
MKKTLLVILAAIASVGVFAQENTNGGDLRMANHHRFSVGLRGGAALSMIKAADAQKQVGHDEFLDLQYAYYWGAKEGKKVNLGIVTGLSVGQNVTSWRGAYSDAFQLNVMGDAIDYKLSCNFNETMQACVAELPLMFSLQTQGGFFFNVGPRFVLPFLGKTQQMLTDGNVIATFVKEGVSLENEPLTGVIPSANYSQKGASTMLNVLLATDFGYEWGFKNGHALGLGVYAAYGIGLTKKAEQTSVIMLEPKANGANLHVNSPAKLATGLPGYCDAGLKLVYHFGFAAKK